jgi:uncharacterized membrane protein SpoIIM required for sporulation
VNAAASIIREREADWDRLDALVTSGGRRSGHLSPAEWLDLSMLYRAACSDAARVRAAGADDETMTSLDSLLARAHSRLYRSQPTRRGAVLRFLSEGFPGALHRNLPAFWWATAAFYAPFLFGLLAGWLLDGFAPAVMGPQAVEMFRDMYATAPDTGRTAGEGSAMAGFYVQHNTTIAFQVFANGIFAGLGSLFMLLYQGLTLGTVFGFLIADEKGRNILTFTCGHSAWELTAITIAGTAGLRMGWALVSTGGLTRLASLRAAGPDVARLIGGAAVMLAMAALIESLWSPSQMDAHVKWGFALVQAALVSSYLIFCGRARPGQVP